VKGFGRLLARGPARWSPSGRCAKPSTRLGLFVGIWAAFALAGPAALAEAIQTTVPHAILMDGETGTVLFEKGADDLVVPASTAKLMTAELVFGRLRAGKLRLDQMFRISETAWRQGGAPSRGSTMFAKLNSEISIDDLLHGLIIDSANDAAIALAEGIAGSQGAFAVLMTNRARELGLPHLTFTDAWGGDDPDQKVTTREMAQLARYIIQTYPDYYKIFGIKEFLWNKIKQPNRNPLLSMDIGADGLKTGNIDSSGYSIVGSAVENNQRLIVAIYGARKATERAEEARKLLQWGFRTFEARKLFRAGDIVGSAQVYGGTSLSVPLETTSEVKVLTPRDGSERLTAKIVYVGPLRAPIEADKQVASLKLYRGPNEVLSVPLRTTATVGVGSLPKRALDAGLAYISDLVRKYVLHS
jgi:D-alanyl-D-alanine carboxypeptidase (penicillin-binding protein 5/6)